MNRTVRAASTALAAAVVVLLSLVLGASAALADVQGEIDAATATFAGGTHLYVATDAGATVDAAAVESAVGSDPTYVAVLSPNTGAADASAAIATELGRKATVVVVSGSSIHADSTVACDEPLAAAVTAQADKHADALGAAGADLTPVLVDVVAAVRAVPTRNCADGGTSATADAGSVLPWVLGAGLVLVIGGGIVVLWLYRRRTSYLSGRRRDVSELVERLREQLADTDAGREELARQAWRDAADRSDAAEGILAGAEIDDDFDAARRAATEGLIAVSTARDLLGLPIDDDIPAIGPIVGPRLTVSQDVKAGGGVHHGYPQYTPGAPYANVGGNGVPAGWYTEPFWENAMGDLLGGDSASSGVRTSADRS